MLDTGMPPEQAQSVTKMATHVVFGAFGAKLDGLKEAQDRMAQTQEKLAQKIEDESNLLSNKID
eukprot:20657-Chlamydomonas_euryale.AAC.1